MSTTKLPSGFLLEIPECETLTESETNLVKKFVSNHLATDRIPECYAYLNETPKSDEDKFIIGYKYLMARKWNMEDAVKMFTDTVSWRETHQYHKRGYWPCAFPLKGYDQELLQSLFHAPPRGKDDRVDAIVQRIQPGYKFAVHKWDLHGHPILIDLTGRMNPKRTVSALKALAPPGEGIAEPFVLLRAYQNELCQYLIRARDADYQTEQAAAGAKEPLRRVTSVTGIMDMSGLGMEHTSGELIDAIKQMLGSTQAYYPEMSYRTYVVNCSPIVMFAFNIIKKWMAPRARNKLVFCSPEETPAVLRAVIDPKNLPKFLGGECECAGGCVCDEAQLVKAKDEAVPSPKLGESPNLTSELCVAARDKERKSFPLREGDLFYWHWDIPHDGYDVEFSVTFTKEKEEKGGDGAEQSHHHHHHHHHVHVVDKVKLSSHKGEFKAPSKGHIALHFDNSDSWLTSKTIRARVGRK